MKAFEYCFKNNMNKLSPEKMKFVASIIQRDIDRLCAERNTDSDTAMWLYVRGFGGGDREIGDWINETASERI